MLAGFMSWSVKEINKPVFPAVCLLVQALKKKKNKATKANRARERSSLFVNVKTFLDWSQKSRADPPASSTTTLIPLPPSQKATYHPLKTAPCAPEREKEEVAKSADLWQHK